MHFGNATQTKMLESGKMHFGCAKMHFCITFSKGKCSASNAFLHSVAEHFPKENVQHQQNVRAASLFFAKQKTQHFCIKCIFAKSKKTKHSKKQRQCVHFTGALRCFAKRHFCIKYIFASNIFLHQIHFCIKYIFASNTFLHQIYFCIKYVFAYIFQKKMFSIFVFCKAKNTAFLQRKMYATQKVKKHQTQHLMQKCI